MNYDRIIIEMLSRIQSLEDEIKELRTMIEGNVQEKNEGKISTADIRDYIEQLKKQATKEGKCTLELRANEIHKALNLKSRFPMVCNAMRQCMNDGDEVLHETASGYSSSLEIRYIL